MSIEVDAVYHNGVLKLDAPVPLKDNERVRITIQPSPGRSYGLIK